MDVASELGINSSQRRNRIALIPKTVLPLFAMLACFAALGSTQSYAQWASPIPPPAEVPMPQMHTTIIVVPPRQRQIDQSAAIALSKSTLSWGSSSRAPSAQAALNRAMEECSKLANDCVNLHWVRNICIVLSTDPSSNNWGVAWNSSAQSAKNDAISQCGTSDCRVAGTSCAND